MRAALRLARKDLARSIRDRSAIAVSIVAPLLLAFILSSVLPEDDLQVTYGFVDEDRGRIAQVFRRQVVEGVAEEFATVETLGGRDEALRRASDDELAAAFVLPAGLSDAVLAGRAASIEVVESPASEVGAPVARSLVEGFVAELNAVALSVGTTVAARGGAAPSREELARLGSVAQQEGTPVVVSDRGAGNREFDTTTFFAAGMAVFFLFFTTQFGAQSLLRERREGTLTRLLAAPMSRRSIVAGKALFTFTLGVVSLAVLLLASRYLFGARWGDPIGVALIVLAAVYAAMGVQSVVTTMAKTDEQAGAYGSVIAVTLGLLGGTFFPLSQAPGAVQALSYATPHAWIMRGLGDLSGGAGGPGDVLLPIVVLLGMGTATGAVALLRATRIVSAR